MRHMKKKLKKAILLFLVAILIAPPGLITTATAAEEQSSLTTVYHETFESGSGVATQSGNANLTQTTKAFDGNSNDKALYVSNRNNDYDAVDFNFSEIGLVNGNTYTVTVTGFVDETETIPPSAQAVLSTVDSYTWLANVNYVAGEAFTLTQEFTVNTSSDSKLRVQSNEDGETVPFYIGEILITAKQETPNEQVVYRESFVDGQGLATRSGGATLTPVTGKDFDGNEDGAALYVSNRSNDFDAVDFNFSEISLINGKTYTVTVTGFVDDSETVPPGAQAVLSTVDSYTWLANVNYVAGEAFTLTREFTVDTSSDSKLRVQSNAEGATVPFYIGGILITEKVSSGGGEQLPPRDQALEFTTIDFEDGELNGFEGRSGTEKLTVTQEANNTDGGSYALKIEDRTVNWHGPALRIEQYIDLGQEYEVSVWVKLISPSSAQLTLSTQVGSGTEGNSASYNNIQSQTVSEGAGWVELKGTYRYNSVGDEFVTIYVESNNANASFFIDDVSFKPTGSGPIEIEDLTPIKEVYENYFLIGNAVSAADLEGVRYELLTKHHNLVTAENAMKPSEVYDGNRNFNFTAQNILVDRALNADLAVHGHVLVWHEQSPSWLWQGLNREDAIENMERHIEKNIENFGNNVMSWDVVNEAIQVNNNHRDDLSNWRNHLRSTGWLNAIGPDYIELAFKKAREVANVNNLDIKLYYNDYNDHFQDKATVMYYMVKELNETHAAENNGELLIDGIGMQGHYHLHESNTADRVRQSIERFLQIPDIEIGVTELDITAGSGGVLTDAEEKAQAYLYAQLFSIYKEHHERISRVTFWGLNDASSWRSDRNPLIFDRNLQAKEAYYAIIDPKGYIEDYVPVDNEDRARSGKAVFGTPVIDGTIDEVWNEAPALPINRFQGAWETGATGEGRVLWDDENLYVLIQVSDSHLDKSNTEAHEQDSVEVFLDQLNSKETTYGDGHGQYRVNFANETSFNPGSIEAGFESATHVNSSGTGYIVEMKIPLTKLTPEDGTVIGFDLQINDARDGERRSVTAWNDTSGNGWQDPSVFGNLTLVKSADSEPTEPGDSDNPTEPTQPANPTQPADPGNPGETSQPVNPATPAVPAQPVVTENPNAVVTNPVISNNRQVTVKNKVTNKVEKDGELVVDLRDNDSSVKVSFTKNQIKKLKQQNALITISNKYVDIQIPASVFTNGDEAVDILIERLNDIDGALSVVYDFKIIQGGKHLSNFDAQITLTFKVDESKVKNLALVKVFYWNPTTKVWELIGGEYKDGFVTVETNHFSTFTVFEMENAEDETIDMPAPTVDDAHKLPNTATNAFNYLLVGLLLLLTATTFFLVNRRKAY